MGFSHEYLRETRQILEELNPDSIEEVVAGLSSVRDAGGRLFVLGVGGSAAHASHSVNDFRKLCGFEAYCPTDNVSELTARVNDDGWETVFEKWLEGSRLSAADCILVLSVGGGNVQAGVSENLVRAVQFAKSVDAKVFGIVGRDGGYTMENADASVLIPPLVAERVTPHTEGLAAVVWHLLVSHPRLRVQTAKWETVENPTSKD